MAVRAASGLAPRPGRAMLASGGPRGFPSLSRWRFASCKLVLRCNSEAISGVNQKYPSGTGSPSRQLNAERGNGDEPKGSRRQTDDGGRTGKRAGSFRNGTGRGDRSGRGGNGRGRRGRGIKGRGKEDDEAIRTGRELDQRVRAPVNGEGRGGSSGRRNNKREIGGRGVGGRADDNDETMKSEREVEKARRQGSPLNGSSIRRRKGRGNKGRRIEGKTNEDGEVMKADRRLQMDVSVNRKRSNTRGEVANGTAPSEVRRQRAEVGRGRGERGTGKGANINIVGVPMRGGRSERRRWSSPLTQFRQESEGLIGRYRPRKRDEGLAPIQEFGFYRGFHEKFALGDVVGKGTFGIVYEAKNRESGASFAVKCLPKKYVGSVLEGLFSLRVQHEVDVLHHVGHSLNVAFFYGAYEDEDAVYLVMEFCKGGELWEILQSGSYTERDAARIIRQILQVVAQCSAKGVLWRDVKPENFLLQPADDGGTPLVKAIDFGLAEYCKADEVLSERAGTPIYIAPEVLKMKYGHKSDVWSTGITAYQLLTGRLPFYGEEGLEVSEKYMVHRTFENKDVFRAVLFADLDFVGSPWDEISEGARDLVMKMLERDPERRPTASEALAHPWLQEHGKGGARADALFSDSIVQRLQRFGTYGRLKQVALRTMVTNLALDNELMASLQDMLKELDWCQSGRVFYSDLRAALESDRFNLSPTELEQLTSHMAIDDHGYIDTSTWLAAMLDWRQLQQSAEWGRLVEAAFSSFERKGRIGKKELQRMFGGEQHELPDVITAALREADIDGDDHITMSDFVKFMTFSERDKLELFDNRLSVDFDATD